ncbi:late embryogenesis abundant protein [Hordeum vulgare]|nr:late embryogenesis abundant protein [Hordeum vulgare]
MPKPEATLDKVSFKGMTHEAITVHSHVNVTKPYSTASPSATLPSPSSAASSMFPPSYHLLPPLIYIALHEDIHPWMMDLTATVLLNNRAVASGMIPDPGWIEDSGEVTKLVVPAKLPYDFLISLIKDLGRDWDIDYELLVKLPIDLPISGKLHLPQSPAYSPSSSSSSSGVASCA